MLHSDILTLLKYALSFAKAYELIAATILWLQISLASVEKLKSARRVFCVQYNRGKEDGDK